MIKKAFFTLLLISAAGILYSQTDDFGLWYEISAEHKLLKKLELDFSAEIRTFDNASKIDVAFLEGGLTYKFVKNLSVGAGYRPEYCREKDNSFQLRHKWYSELKGNLPMGRLSLLARIRFEQRYKTYYLDENDNIPSSHARYRLKAIYNIPKFPVNPYVSAEIFCPMFKKDARTIDKDRFVCGFEYNFAKRKSLEIEYAFQRDYFPHMSDINIIALNLNFKL